MSGEPAQPVLSSYHMVGDHDELDVRRVGFIDTGVPTWNSQGVPPIASESCSSSRRAVPWERTVLSLSLRRSGTPVVVLTTLAMGIAAGSASTARAIVGVPQVARIRVGDGSMETVTASARTEEGPAEVCTVGRSLRVTVTSGEGGRYGRAFSLSALVCVGSTAGGPSIANTEEPQVLWLIDGRGRRHPIRGQLWLRWSSRSSSFPILGELDCRLDSRSGRRVRISFELVPRQQ